MTKKGEREKARSFSNMIETNTQKYVEKLEEQPCNGKKGYT